MIARRPHLVCCLFLAMLPAHAAVADGPAVLTLAPNRHVGETIRFQTTKTRVDLVEGEAVRSTTGRWLGTLEVVAGHDDQFVMRWTRGELRMEATERVHPFVMAMADLWKDVPIDLVWDIRSQRVSAIRNYADVLRQLDQTLATLRHAMLDAGTPSGALDHALATARRAFDDPAAGAALLLNDLTGMIGYGRELNLDGTTRYTLILPNPFGGPPIPAVETWAQPVVVDGGEVYSLAWSQQIDAPAFTDALQTFFKDVAPDADAEAIQRMRQTLEHLTIETTGVYRYDAVRGLITHATLSRQSSIEGRGRIETWEWLVEPKREEP